MAPWPVSLPVAQRLASAAVAAAAGVAASAALTGNHGGYPLMTARADDSAASASPAVPGGMSNLGAVLGFPRVHPGLAGVAPPAGSADTRDPSAATGAGPPPAPPSPSAAPTSGSSSGGGGWFGFGGSKKPADTPSDGSYQSPGGPPPGPPPASAGGSERARNQNPNPRDTAAGFDPEALERGARALREINKSANAKQVFEVMRKQEETRQLEEKARLAELQAYQAQQETDRQRMMLEEQRKLVQQKAQTEAQLARYNDELARKRMQAEHEAQRTRNAELVAMQEESALKQENLRRATEEQIQSQMRQTDLARAEIERETLKQKAMAEAEARAHEARLSEDVNRRLLLEKAQKESEKWVAAINATFSHIGGGLKALLTDQNKLVVTVGGVTALAAGVYTTREGARVLWSYVDRILGQPALVRESSLGPYPWSSLLRRARLAAAAPFANRAAAKATAEAASSTGAGAAAGSTAGSAAGAGAGVAAGTGAAPGVPQVASAAVAGALMRSGQGFGDVVLAPSLHQRIRQLAAATANTRRHGAPFRNMLFYGPPGTGKTMAAKELARQSGLDYALMTGGDVAPLGPQAVTKIHQMFDWAAKSRRGLLLFIDEADAFLAERNRVTMSEAQRSALNALLFRTGDQSRDIVLVLATNRPGDLDSAINDRMDELIEFPLPGAEERFRLLQLYLHQYVTSAGTPASWTQGLWRRQERIEVTGVTDDVLQEAAARLEGFSGREIAKLMASVRGAVYGSKASVLDAKLFREVVDYKVAEHKQRAEMAAKGYGTAPSAAAA